jgi:hypothetical protein
MLNADRLSDRVTNQVVHRSRDRTIQRFSKADRAAGRGYKLVVAKGLSIVFHEFTEAAQHPFDEHAIKGNALAVQDGRVERLGVGDEDVLSSVCREQMARPIRVSIGALKPASNRRFKTGQRLNRSSSELL